VLSTLGDLLLKTVITNACQPLEQERCKSTSGLDGVIQMPYTVPTFAFSCYSEAKASSFQVFQSLVLRGQFISIDQ